MFHDMKIKMGEVKHSMKARVKILVNGAAATLLTGAVAAGLILFNRCTPDKE